MRRFEKMPGRRAGQQDELRPAGTVFCLRPGNAIEASNESRACRIDTLGRLRL